MQVKDLSTPLMKGRMGNLIYYVRNGKQCVRRVAIPGKKRKWEEEGRTTKQKTVTGRFAIVQAFYSKYSECISPEIWRLAAREERRMAPNLFNSVNSHCFSGDGELIDFEKFRFTQGCLVLPRKIRMEQKGKYYRITWEEERNLETAAPTDRLCVGVLYAGYPLAPRLALETSGVRADLYGEFRLDETMGKEAHVYCFFARENETAFSESCYFKIDIE